MKAVLGLLLRFPLLIALLLGVWGFDDLRGFFAHPARAGLVLALAGTGVVATIMFPNLRAFQKGEKRTGTGLLVAWIVVWSSLPPFSKRSRRHGAAAKGKSN